MRRVLPHRSRQNAARAHLLNMGIVLPGLPPFCTLKEFPVLACAATRRLRIPRFANHSIGTAWPAQIGAAFSEYFRLIRTIHGLFIEISLDTAGSLLYFPLR